MSKRLIASISLLAVAIAGWVLLGAVHRSPQLEIRVVDANGAPVEGAVVVASWLLIGAINGARLEYLAIQETRTDSRGVFVLKEWGPLLRAKGSLMDQPVVRVLLAGYQPFVKTNLGGRSIVDGAALTLLPTSGIQADDAMVLRLFASQLASDFDMPPFQCEFKKIPLMVDALRQADLQLIDAGAPSVLPGEFSPSYSQCSQPSQSQEARK